ncbi:MAG: hypothetical protein SGILL_006725 [Bacillariaceae sp.]
MKGKLMGLEDAVLLKAMQAIFKMHDTFNNSFFSANKMTWDEVTSAVSNVNLDVGDHSEGDTATQATDVDTVHTSATAVGHLHAFALTFVSMKLSTSDQERVDAIVGQFFKSSETKPAAN